MLTESSKVINLASLYETSDTREKINISVYNKAIDLFRRLNVRLEMASDLVPYYFLTKSSSLKKYWYSISEFSDLSIG